MWAARVGRAAAMADGAPARGAIEGNGAGGSPAARLANTAEATAALHRRKRAPGIALNCGVGAGVRHVGIVFVHGIGSQAAGETLLDWGGSMIRVLLDARLRHKKSAD